MTTIDDRATEREEQDRELAQKYRKPVPEHHGECLECGAQCAGAFCDADCRETYEQRERFNR